MTRDDSPGWLTRIGMAIVEPRAAFTLAGQRRYAGRAGSDLLALLAVLLLATQLRAIVSAFWLGSAVEMTLGLRAIVRVLTDVLTIVLGFLVIGAVALWATSGPRRELGRAFDLACVCVLPIIFVDLAATLVVTALGLSVPRAAMLGVSGVAYAWTGVLVVVAIVQTRKPALPADKTDRARLAGWGVAAVAAAGLLVQGVWVVRNLDQMKPMVPGDAAPAFALPKIEAGGALGAPVALADSKGKVIVVDFWATWCNPCLRALPHLARLQQQHPELAVITINLDDAAEARALYDERGYELTLLAGDQATSERYGVAAIPHTVVIDRSGVVRRVIRGGNVNLENVVAPLLK